MNIEVFDNLTYESEMFLLSHLQLSKRLLQNNMAFAAVRCLNNNLKAKKHIISITQHFTIVHPTFPSITSKVWQESIANFFFHIKSPKTPRNPLLYQKNIFSPKTSLLFVRKPSNLQPFLLFTKPRSGPVSCDFFSGSHGTGLCLFDVLGNLDLSKRNAPGLFRVCRYISTTTQQYLPACGSFCCGKCNVGKYTRQSWILWSYGPMGCSKCYILWIQ